MQITEEILEASEYFYNPAQGVWGRLWTEAECLAYEDDWDAMYYKTNGGYAYGDWASAGYPHGEAGSNHISRCIPISRRAYEAAKAERWEIDVLIAVVG